MTRLLFRFRKWLIEKLGGMLVEPLSYHYLITAVNQRGETVPWTTINPNKRKSKYNRIEFYNFYQNDELKFVLPIRKEGKK